MDTTSNPEMKVINLLGCIEHKAADRDLTVDRGYIYVVLAEGLGLYKIGMATDLTQRLSTHRGSCPVPLHPVLSFTVPKLDMYEIEQAVHAKYDERRVRGEWFALTGDDLAGMPEAVQRIAKRGLNELEREIARSGRLRYNEAEIKRSQHFAQLIARIQSESAIPTDELVMDRVTDACQSGEPVTSLDLSRSIDRKPTVVHEAIRNLIRAGEVAIVSPRRNPNGGSVWLNDAYRHRPLIIPDATCDWELTLCGHEILISEPPGRLVPEFFYCSRWALTRG